MKNNKFVFIYIFVFICSLVLFLIGFFPAEKRTGNKFDVRNDIPLRRDPVAVKKFVLMIVDAMRIDFLTSSTNNGELRMPYLQTSVLNNESCFLTVRTAAPTVTMPRIKAITSGALPHFFDIVRNLGSSEFTHDTFLHRAKAAQLKMVFYGDDTWLRMFPSMFTRSGGVHSFFAADFWDVDNNITSRMKNELGRNDWDIMILHYLGLDHIGHMEGPQSPHIGRKLKEMDDVISLVLDGLRKMGEKFLFLVTADHGMKDSGGHGGVTGPEINVPLVSIGKPCNNFSGWPGAGEYVPDQVDLASTISVVLGLETPVGITGKLIPAVLGDIPDTILCQRMHETKRNLMKRLGRNEDAENNCERFTEDTGKQYFKDLERLTSELKKTNEFNLPCVVISCTLMWVILLTFAITLKNLRPNNSLHVLLILGSLCHTFSLASSSFIEEEHQTWYFLWITLLLLSVRERLRRKLLAHTFVPDIEVCSLVGLCFLHRLLRKLNQTGDKWAHLPDWEDSLRANPNVLLVLFITGLRWLFSLFRESSDSRRDQTIVAAALFTVLLYRVTTRSINSSFTNFYSQSTGSLEVSAFYFALIIYAHRSGKRGKIDVAWLWILISTLTFRPHNVILIPTQIFVSEQLHSVFQRDTSKFWNTLAHIWMGNVFYFYQGHSNSFANIDIAPAFIGAWSYNPVYGGLMTIIHTYASPILSFILSPKDYGALLFSRILPMTFYCTAMYFLRHHLFVWSVFSPKLLLDCSLTLVIFIALICHRCSLKK